VYRFFERLVDPYPAPDGRTPPTKLFAFLYYYSRPVLPWMAVMAVLTGALSLLEILFFSFTGYLVDWLATANPATFVADNLWTLIGMGAVVVVALPLLQLVQSLFVFQTVFGNYPMLVRWRFHRHMLGQSLGFFQDEFAGRVSQKLMQTASSVRETVQKLLDTGVYVVTYFLGMAALMSQMDIWLSVPLLFWLAGYIALLSWFVPRLNSIGRKQADARAEMTGRIVDSYANIQTVKLFAHTTRELSYARDAMSGFMTTVYAQSRLITGLNVRLTLLNSLLLASVGAVAIFSWQRSLVSIGAITVAVGLVLRLRSLAGWIMWEVAGLFENIGTVIDGMGMLAKPVTVTDAADAKPLVVSKGEIRFEDVRFHYGRQSGVIEDFSLTVKPGEKIGIVGRSGAGKSTLVNLLLRFYDLQGGRILIDGQDIAHVTQESLREQIGVVTQDTSLLHRSVEDNILYGRPGAGEAAMVDAARRAEAHEFITGLEDPKKRKGYAAHVGERGVKLSGGQRQRVAIARLILKDAPILVLDEATSALDSEVEAAIQSSLYGLMEGKTVIAIAHRLSTIAVLDRLVVVDDGRILEVGTHQELLKQNGLYAALWRRQSGGFLGLDPVLEQTAAE
jgi:ATP-binding cassette subfamily B multidrug efflux pump